MKIKKEVLKELRRIIKYYHNGNISDFSRESKIDKSYISEVLAIKRGIGITFISKMNAYCDGKKIKRINFFSQTIHVHKQKRIKSKGD